MNAEWNAKIDEGARMMNENGEGQGAEAVKLPNGKEIDPKTQAFFDGLGAMDDGAEMILHPRDLPPPIIDGILLQKEFAAVTSDSKARKSFFLLLWAACCAYGYPFLGFATHPLDVAYLNFELFPGAVDWRLARIKDALVGQYLKNRFAPGKLHVWQLRGKGGLTPDNLADAILYRAWKENFTPGLVIIDPAYKLWQGKDEISSADMGVAYGKLFNLPEELNAAVVACLHAPKGNNDKRRGLDLYSGAGVGGRSMDVAVALRIKHDEIDGPAPLTRVEITRRHLAAPEPFCIRWNPSKNVPEKTDEAWERPPRNSPATGTQGKAGFDVVDCFATPDTRLTAKELEEKYLAGTGCTSPSTADNMKRRETAKGGLLSKSGKGTGTRYFLSPAGRKRWAERHPGEAATAGDLPNVNLPPPGEGTATPADEAPAGVPAGAECIPAAGCP